MERYNWILNKLACPITSLDAIIYTIFSNKCLNLSQTSYAIFSLVLLFCGANAHKCYAVNIKLAECWQQFKGVDTVVETNAIVTRCIFLVPKCTYIRFFSINLIQFECPQKWASISRIPSQYGNSSGSWSPCMWKMPRLNKMWLHITLYS